MSKKKPEKPDAEAETLKAKRELFCRYYTQNQALFGNATLCYAEAFDYDLDSYSQGGGLHLPEGHEEREIIDESPYDKAYHVCSVQGSKLLRNADIQARIRVLLNELLKDEVVDSELAKLISQDGDLPTKIRSIAEYNKLRGRIIDKTKDVTERFAMETSARSWPRSLGFVKWFLQLRNIVDMGGSPLSSMLRCPGRDQGGASNVDAARQRRTSTRPSSRRIPRWRETPD